MLGIRSVPGSWRWAACGKHPAAKDFFRVGWESPMLSGLASWVDKGYHDVASKRKSDFYSWRFWTGGPPGETVICGLVKDSCDYLGRPYPLLIVGSGLLEGWRERWDLVPFACGAAWERMEHISVQDISDVKKLETEILRVRPPIPEWGEFERRIEKFMAERHMGRGEDIAGGDAAVAQQLEMRQTERQEVFISLDDDSVHDKLLLAGAWLSFFKAGAKDPPNTFFVGGTLKNIYLVFFRRPLAPADFVALWKISPEGIKEDGTLVAR